MTATSGKDNALEHSVFIRTSKNLPPESVTGHK